MHCDRPAPNTASKAEVSPKLRPFFANADFKSQDTVPRQFVCKFPYNPLPPPVIHKSGPSDSAEQATLSAIQTIPVRIAMEWEIATRQRTKSAFHASLKSATSYACASVRPSGPLTEGDRRTSTHTAINVTEETLHYMTDLRAPTLHNGLDYGKVKANLANPVSDDGISCSDPCLPANDGILAASPVNLDLENLGIESCSSWTLH
ncbi:unnamed protein product [Mesocestoides corti]|uniref:Uncharacterized protein n=1 Tax=Mesocestoides corti TaxID=53468 RepID=A0A0R3UI06_MESCO|nr:unnamed protein product [Mesocestoides corti]